MTRQGARPAPVTDAQIARCVQGILQSHVRLAGVTADSLPKRSRRTVENIDGEGAQVVFIGHNPFQDACVEYHGHYGDWVAFFTPRGLVGKAYRLPAPMVIPTAEEVHQATMKALFGVEV